jgi:hypothetical protein
MSFQLETLFDADDGHDSTVRIELRIKYAPGPFDSAGWSLVVQVGKTLLAMESQARKPETELHDLLVEVLATLEALTIAERLVPVARAKRWRSRRS